MLIKSEFEVAEPVEKVWQFFENIPQVAACLPGAEITEELVRHGYRLSQGTLYPTLHMLEELGYRVQAGVGRRVVSLPGRAQRPGYRGEQHECIQVQAHSELVQVRCGGSLGGQHRSQPSRGECVHHSVVEHPGGVHHSAYRDPRPGQPAP